MVKMVKEEIRYDAMSNVQDHFDHVAENYDYWKNRNWYYYAELKNLLSDLIPPGQKVLEIGCATGDLLAHVRPSYGLGLDISPEMIHLAQRKHNDNQSLYFCADSVEALRTDTEFDYVFMADVIEHLSDVSGTLKAIQQIARPQTSFIMTMANPLWEPLLLLLEKMHLKMPEGPHHRLPLQAVRELVDGEGFSLKAEGRRVLVPMSIPLVSRMINRHFYRVPLLREAGLIAWFTCRKRG
jgi:ubiquinone/menaquinone biosynthesis C-methylase UbiE